MALRRAFTALAATVLVVMAPLSGAACARTEPVEASSPDLSWMSGHWRNGGPDTFSEELWTTPEGGLLLAVTRTVRDGEAVMFEFLRVEIGETVVLTAQPGGAAGTPFQAVEFGPQRVVFANPDNEYPTHIEYARDGEDLTARIWGEDGPGSGPSWRWARVDD